jgi:hypothetical protein
MVRVVDKSESSQPSQSGAWIDIVRNHVSSLRFGHIQIVVHNSQVVQVERTERIRFNRPTPESETQSTE